MKSYLLFFLFLFNIISSIMYSQTVLPLYADGIPNSKPAVDEETVEYNGDIKTIRKVSIPTITVYLPPENIANGTAVVICPGGGYWAVTIDMEGTDVAKKFNEMGVAAIVLKYRIPNDAWMINREIGPLQDAQQAIKTVREISIPTGLALWAFLPADIWHPQPEHILIKSTSPTAATPAFVRIL
jgi:hypothetical protein